MSDNSKSAILVVEFQKTWTERSFFHRLIKQTMDTLISDGYECILVSDCTATRNSKLQQKIKNKRTSIKSKQIIEEIANLV